MPTLELCIILEDGLQVLTLCRIDILLLSEERDSGWQFFRSLTEGLPRDVCRSVECHLNVIKA